MSESIFKKRKGPLWTLFCLLMVLTATAGTLLAVEGISSLLLRHDADFSTKRSSKKTSARALLPYEIPGSLHRQRKYEGEPFHLRSEVDYSKLIDEGDFYLLETPRRLVKNFSGRMKRYNPESGFTIYDAKISTDEWGRRKSRDTSRPRTARQHLLLVGCSYVFGSALNDEETLAWHINEQQSEVEAYNAGVDAFGTSDILARFLTGNELQGVSQKKGILVYGFIGDHLPRTVGSSAIPWVGNASHVIENSNGEFVFTGTQQAAHPWRRAFYRWFAERNFVKLFGLSLPILRSAHYESLVRQISQIEKIYQQQSQVENPMIVVIYPQTFKELDMDVFRKTLSRHKIRFIDYSGLDISHYVNGKSHVDYDAHPNGAANRVFSEVMLRDLQSFL